MIGEIQHVTGGIRTDGTGRDPHIQNRRLFNLAAGTIALKRWERDHLHECMVCQTMASLLIRSILRFPDLEFKDVRG